MLHTLSPTWSTSRALPVSYTFRFAWLASQRELEIRFKRTSIRKTANRSLRAHCTCVAVHGVCCSLSADLLEFPTVLCCTILRATYTILLLNLFLQPAIWWIAVSFVGLSPAVWVLTLHWVLRRAVAKTSVWPEVDVRGKCLTSEGTKPRRK